MAIRYVRSGGDTGAWTGTYASVTLALSGITSADTIYVAPDHNHTATAAITWTLPTTPGLRIICADSTASAPPTGTATTAVESVGASSNSFIVNGFAYIYGIKLNGGTNNSAQCVVSLANAATPHGIYAEACQFVLNTTNTSGAINIGSAASATADDVEVRLAGCTVSCNSSSHTVRLQTGRIRAQGLTLAGTAPTTLFTSVASTYADARVECSDLSGVTWTNLYSVSGGTSGRLHVDRCKLPSGFVATTGAFPSAGGVELLITDSRSGDTHGTFQHHNALGSTITESGIYLTSGPSAYSWKIVTTSAANYATPYVAPILSVYHSGTSAITPYVEILRDGSTTAYQTDEVWTEVCAKVTASSTRATMATGRMALLGSAANITTGAGLGSWTGEGGTAWSGKLDGAGSVTPAEAGMLSMYVVVGEPGITVYVDPVIRT